MKISSFVVDSSNGQPIDGASVFIIDPSGKSLGKGVVASSDGGFELSSTLLDTAGNKVRITAVDYDTQDISPANFPDEVGMDVSADTLGTVDFVFKRVKKVARAKYTVPIVLGSAAVLLATWGLFKKYHK